MNNAELVVRRRLVREFIKADRVTVQFTRRTARTRTEAGGYITAPSEPLPPQTARVVPSKRRYDNGLVNSEAGAIPHTEYLLIGYPDMDVEVNDIFFWNGDQYQITGIAPKRHDRTLCSMMLKGPPNG